MIRLDVGEMYNVGVPVRVAVTLDPGDPPLNLPSKKPYRILSGHSIVHAPTAPEASWRLSPGEYPVIWHWDQVNDNGTPVGPGEYSVRLYTVDAGERQREFKIVSKWAWRQTLKQTAKWAKRGCLVVGSFAFYFQPVVGGVIGAAGVAFGALEADPPSEDFEFQVDKEDLLETAAKRIPALYERFRSNESLWPGITMAVASLALIHDYTVAITQSLERLDGARQAASEEHVYLHATKLKVFCGAAVKRIRSFPEHLKIIASPPPESSGLLYKNENKIFAKEGLKPTNRDWLLQPGCFLPRDHAKVAQREILKRWGPFVLADAGIAEAYGAAAAGLPDAIGREAFVQLDLALQRFGDVLETIAALPIDGIVNPPGLTVDEMNPAWAKWSVGQVVS